MNTTTSDLLDKLIRALTTTHFWNLDILQISNQSSTVSQIQVCTLIKANCKDKDVDAPITFGKSLTFVVSLVEILAARVFLKPHQLLSFLQKFKIE